VSSPAITNARAKPANADDIATGLLARCTFTYGELKLEAVVRRTVNGRVYLSFPARTVGARRVPHIEPLDQKARERIEREVLGQLGFASERRRA